MTELEWEECDNARVLVAALRLPDPPELMFLGPEDELWRITPRQRRLTGTAVCERIEHLLPLGSRYVLDASWTLAEGKIDIVGFRAAWAHVPAWMSSDSAFLRRPTCMNYAEQALLNLGEWPRLDRLLEAAGWALIRETSESTAAADLVAQTQIVRCVVGNPFRTVAFDRAWATCTATTLARQMYDSREFGAMPILADALQDAGCESEDILAHCRDPHAVHVRGCWVCDLVLAKG